MHNTPPNIPAIVCNSPHQQENKQCENAVKYLLVKYDEYINLQQRFQTLYEEHLQLEEMYYNLQMQLKREKGV